MNNAHGTITRTNNEWSAQGRQDEDGLRGMRRRGRIESIADQLASWADEGAEFVIGYEPAPDDDELGPFDFGDRGEEICRCADCVSTPGFAVDLRYLGAA